MALQRGLNKRGQDLTIGTLILIVLGVVVLVFLIIGFTRGWDFIFGKFSIAPGQDLEAVAQSCKIAAQGNLQVDFCSFKEVEVDGETRYVNCMYSGLDESLSDIQNKPSCTTSTPESYCTTTLKGTADRAPAACDTSVKVNDFVCCT